MSNSTAIVQVAECSALTVPAWREDLWPEEGGAWSPAQQAFQAWLALPKESREPLTQGELARALGVVPETLSRWKRLPGFRRAVTALARQYLEVALPEVYAALSREARGGSLPHIKLLLELVGEYPVVVEAKAGHADDSFRQELMRKIELVYGQGAA